MRAETVGVGTELLLGQIADTNARWIAQRLAEIGVDVLYHQVVGDNHGRIVEALWLAVSRSDVVLVTGGLGPTQDDITREAIAEVAGVRLVRMPEIAAAIRQRFATMRREMPESNLRQADVPEGGRAITPRRGTAPGLVVEVGRARIYALPGVPVEMQEMMEDTILPELAAEVGPSGIASRIVRCVGISESKIAELLDDVFHGSSNPTVAFLAGGGEVKVRLTAKASSLSEAEELIAPVADVVVRRLGDAVIGTDDQDLEVVVGGLLAERRRTLALAESLTGGGVAFRITSVAGSSTYFRGGIVAYTADAKRDLLGVSPDTIEREGVVSEACAREMAAGARRALGADIGLSLTGAAGPEPHDGAEVGLVWIGLDADDVRHARSITAPADRAIVRRWAEQAALDLLRRYLVGAALPTGRSLV